MSLLNTPVNIYSGGRKSDQTLRQITSVKENRSQWFHTACGPVNKIRREEWIRATLINDTQQCLYNSATSLKFVREHFGSLHPYWENILVTDETKVVGGE